MPPSSRLASRAPLGLQPPRSALIWLRQLLSLTGPGFLVAVGYMDPGNWATDLAGGSAYAYSLLWIVALSSLMAMFLQILASRLGIVTGLDLAQACRLHSTPRSCFWQWILAETAICATDLAELIGTAIALNLLFGIPLFWGVLLTVFNVLLVLWPQQRGRRALEALIMALLALVFVCVMINVVLARPVWGEVVRGFIPGGELLHRPGMLYIAIGIIGATVMPHNLYLHSASVRTRPDVSIVRNLQLVRSEVLIALTLAFLVNAALLVMSAAVFHAHGYTGVAEIQDAHALLTPLMGGTLAATLFGIALLAAGQSSSLTATLAGQIVMEGYIQLRLPAWARRLETRAVALVPALLITVWFGESGLAQMLILSQVLLSLQLPFAVIPLIRLTSNPALMGQFANGGGIRGVAWLVGALIISLNVAMLIGLVLGR